MKLTIVGVSTEPAQSGAVETKVTLELQTAQGHPIGKPMAFRVVVGVDAVIGLTDNPQIGQEFLQIVPSRH